jgi:branched-chain amino acid transport system permease protein
VQNFRRGRYALQLVIPVAGLLLAAALQIALQKTRTGKALLAVVQNPDAARLMGINVKQTITGAFALSTALQDWRASDRAAVQCDRGHGCGFGIKAFAVAILGGITSASGIMAAGLIYGLIEAMGDSFVRLCVHADRRLLGCHCRACLHAAAGFWDAQASNKV